ncbi:MAG TPA: MFS transporter [Solirubrobacteraceae bacterium]
MASTQRTGQTQRRERFTPRAATGTTSPRPTGAADDVGATAARKHIFWASYFGWLLDGFDTTIYAFVLVPALKVILPASGVSATDTPHWGLTFFAIFLAGWGSSFLIGLLADRVGRLRALGFSIALYAIGTLASGLAHNIPEFAAARFVAGLGLGAEWFIGGTGVAEAFPENERPKWTGRFHSAWYAGFILAAAIVPFIVGPIGWRGVFFIGIIPAVLLFYIRMKAEEPRRWIKEKEKLGSELNMRNSLRTILDRDHRKDTIILALIMVPVITGLYGGTLFVPTALTTLHDVTNASIKPTYLIAIGGSIIAAFTLVTCLLVPKLAERLGRRRALALLMGFMAVGLPLVFLWAFKANDLTLFLLMLVFLGIGGADFAIFSLWLPEVYPTRARAGGFAFVTTIGRFAGAGLTFAIGALNDAVGLGTSLSLTAIFFVIGMLLLPFAREGRGELEADTS